MAKRTRKENVKRIADRCEAEEGPHFAGLKPTEFPVYVSYERMKIRNGMPTRCIARASYIGQKPTPDKSSGFVRFLDSPDDDTPHIVQDGMRLAAQRVADMKNSRYRRLVKGDLPSDPWEGLYDDEIEMRNKSSAERISDLIGVMSMSNQILGVMKLKPTALVDMSPKSIITALNEMTIGQLADEYRKARAAKPKGASLSALLYEDSWITEKRKRCDMVMDLADDIASAKFGVGFYVSEA